VISDLVAESLIFIFLFSDSNFIKDSSGFLFFSPWNNLSIISRDLFSNLFEEHPIKTNIRMKKEYLIMFRIILKVFNMEIV
jgi:hypothetical protein